MRWLALLLVALALLGAGCGGDDEQAASDETTVEETLTDDTTVDETTDESSSFDFASEDCQSLVAAYVAISSALGSASGGDDLSDEVEQFAELAANVPDEIRADVQVLAEAYGEYIDVIRDAGLEPGEIPSAEQAQELQDALQSVGAAEVTAASERLSAWTTQNC